MTKSVYIVADIHGCDYKLKELLKKISRHREDIQDRYESAELIFLGDYIDRGPNSKNILEIVRSLQPNHLFDDVIALMGNHEEMLLRADYHYLDKRLWIDNGGEETILSFLNKGEVAPLTISELIGKSMMDWIKERPYFYEVGDIGISHAGIDDPTERAYNQSPDSLIWSRELRLDPHDIYKYTVHGHTPMKTPLVDTHVAYIDTGAVFGGKLTCLFIGDVYNPVDHMEIISS